VPHANAVRKRKVVDPDVVLRSDGGVARRGATLAVRGAVAVAGQALTFARLAPFVRPAPVNGAACAIVAPRRRLFSVIGFTVAAGKTIEIDVLADPERLRHVGLAVLDD
jgi:RNA polymerase sigma-70 factor (ECF subfamily)